MKLIDSDKDLKENYTNEVKELVTSDKELQKLYKISSVLYGLKRQTSIHAAGVVISSYDLKDIVPVLKTNNELIIGLTMDQLEENGLLKMDFLALKNLTTIKEIVKNINTASWICETIIQIQLSCHWNTRGYNKIEAEKHLKY